jgi:ribose transport system substrate-binding protein
LLEARARRVRGADLAIEILAFLARRGGTRVAELVRELDAPRASLYRAAASLAEAGALDLGRRGWIALGPLAIHLARRRDEALRREDIDRVAPKRSGPRHGGVLVRDPASLRVAPAARFRRAPKYRIGFANAALDSPWRTALVHSVEYGAVKYRAWISDLSVRHAAHCARKQAADIEDLLRSGVEGLIVSAVTAEPIAAVLADAERAGVPTVLVDRGLPESIPHMSFVTCDDHVIGVTTALWLAERLEGRGRLVLLPGLEAAEPAQRRLVGAMSVFRGFPQIEALATEWTSWSAAEAYRIMTGCLETFGRDIDGVWCDSGLQAVGSLKTFLRDKRFAHAIPPHTGGDLNLAYKLAIRHKTPLAAVDYPPAMGLRAVEVLLDILRGRDVPRRVDVATETVVTRGHATASVKPDLWADEHVRWDLADDLILASGLGVSYDPRKFRVRYRGNRYNRSAAAEVAAP